MEGEGGRPRFDDPHPRFDGMTSQNKSKLMISRSGATIRYFVRICLSPVCLDCCTLFCLVDIKKRSFLISYVF